MPASLTFDAEPCPAQREMMEASGFKLEEQTEHHDRITWRGHGVTITLAQHGKLSPCALLAMVAKQCREQGILSQRRKMWDALGLADLSVPVPYELVEMDLASDKR